MNIKHRQLPQMRVTALLRIFFLSATATCPSYANNCRVSTVLSCPDVYAALVSRVRCVSSECPYTIEPAACMKDKLMRRVFTWAADAGVPTLDATTATVAWNASCTQLADIVALSILGRAFVQTQSQEAVYFEFNTASGSLQLRPLGCEFQRPLYTVVLLSALFALSFVLVYQHMHETQAPNKAQ